jgi:hypothetical protein
LKQFDADKRDHLFTMYAGIAKIEPKYKEEVSLNEFLRNTIPDFESFINPLVKEFATAKS